MDESCEFISLSHEIYVIKHTPSIFSALFGIRVFFLRLSIVTGISSLSGYTYLCQQLEGTISIGGIEDLRSRFIEVAMG